MVTRRGENGTPTTVKLPTTNGVLTTDKRILIKILGSPFIDSEGMNAKLSKKPGRNSMKRKESVTLIADKTSWVKLKMIKMIPIDAKM